MLCSMDEISDPGWAWCYGFTGQPWLGSCKSLVAQAAEDLTRCDAVLSRTNAFTRRTAITAHGSRHEKSLCGFVSRIVQQDEDWEEHDPFNHCLSLAANEQNYLPHLV